jgi:predicted adenine nucleotide alpha hydrolase (AANH) superfamily ATPase
VAKIMNILLHICCSNCATYPVRLIRQDNHNLAGFWFNPNIQPFDEYRSRFDSAQDLAGRWHFDLFGDEEYTPGEYFRMFNIDESGDLDGDVYDVGRRQKPERPDRCRRCYELRLEKTAREASVRGFEAFSTTLLISPYQDYDQIMTTGREVAGRYDLIFFQRDFRPCFRDAGKLAAELGLYRQKYCGCMFSRDERDRNKKTRSCKK